MMAVVIDAGLNNGFFQRYEHPTEGTLVAMPHPVSFSASPGGMRLPPPRLGEHNAEILGELGYSGAEIDEICRMG
jgi:crotonobetainyl-CoA:carnitine CoA-transferase CaiB-like acyl-CoA transferase